MKHLEHIANLAYGGLMRTKTPDDVAEELIKNGHAKMTPGGLVATDEAQRLLVQNGMKPPRWQ